MISFLAGKPNAATFPFESITLNLKSPVPFQHASDNGKANGHSEEITSIDISGPELDEALQYGATSGLPALIKVRRRSPLALVRIDGSLYSGWRAFKPSRIIATRRMRIGG